jgi:hypothetical protein
MTGAKPWFWLVLLALAAVAVPAAGAEVARVRTAAELAQQLQQVQAGPQGEVPTVMLDLNISLSTLPSSGIQVPTSVNLCGSSTPTELDLAGRSGAFLLARGATMTFCNITLSNLMFIPSEGISYGLEQLALPIWAVQAER